MKKSLAVMILAVAFLAPLACQRPLIPVIPFTPPVATPTPTPVIFTFTSTPSKTSTSSWTPTSSFTSTPSLTPTPTFTSTVSANATLTSTPVCVNYVPPGTTPVPPGLVLPGNPLATPVPYSPMNPFVIQNLTEWQAKYGSATPNLDFNTQMVIGAQFNIICGMGSSIVKVCEDAGQVTVWVSQPGQPMCYSLITVTQTIIVPQSNLPIVWMML